MYAPETTPVHAANHAATPVITEDLTATAPGGVPTAKKVDSTKEKEILEQHVWERIRKQKELQKQRNSNVAPMLSGEDAANVGRELAAHMRAALANAANHAATPVHAGDCTTTPVIADARVASPFKGISGTSSSNVFGVGGDVASAFLSAEDAASRELEALMGGAHLHLPPFDTANHAATPVISNNLTATPVHAGDCTATPIIADAPTASPFKRISGKSSYHAVAFGGDVAPALLGEDAASHGTFTPELNAHIENWRTWYMANQAATPGIADDPTATPVSADDPVATHVLLAVPGTTPALPATAATTTPTPAVRDFVSMIDTVVLSGEDLAGSEDLAARMRALLKETKAAGDSASSNEGSEEEEEQWFPRDHLDKYEEEDEWEHVVRGEN